MSVTRKEFLKISGTVIAGLLVGGIATLKRMSFSKKKLRGAKIERKICPLCAMGCGVVVYKKNNTIISVQGDKESPVNRGVLCAKGASLFQLMNNTQRLQKIKYKRPYASQWEYLDWDQAIEKIAVLIKKTRDASFVASEKGIPVHRTEGIAALAGNRLTNEEAYLLNKFCRILGITDVGTEAVLGNSEVFEALKATFGISAMTNPWYDIKQAQVILIIGADPARSSAVAFQHIMAAKQQGAKIITIDPVFSRTAAVSDIYCPIKPGTDIALIHCLVHYALQNEKIQKEYLVEYTDAAYILGNDYFFDAENNLFSGYDKKLFRYTDRSSWDYARDNRANPLKDDDLRHKNCVYNILKKHVASYSINNVAKITGCPSELLMQVAELFTATSKQQAAGAIVYGPGIINHTSGGQSARALSMLQLLLGNMGVSGGGLYGGGQDSNAQGVFDQLGVWHDFPGALPLPQYNDDSLHSYVRNNMLHSNDPMSINVRQYVGAHITSLLKAWFGHGASKSNRYHFDLLPKISESNTTYGFLEKCRNTKQYKGVFCFSLDPYQQKVHPDQVYDAFSSLDWLVISDSWDSTSLNGQYYIEKKHKTEIFILPTLNLFEKEGSITNTERMVQWNHGSWENGEQKHGVWILDRLFRKVKQFYNTQNGVFPLSIATAEWPYKDSSSVAVLAKEIAGMKPGTETSYELVSFSELRDDGSTQCGNWLYCGMFADNNNLSSRRDSDPAACAVPLYNNWAWSWPQNTRILFNRASVNRKGVPWNPRKWIIKNSLFQSDGDVLNGNGVFNEKNPFIFSREGVGHLFASQMQTGPLPVYYEPFTIPRRESPAYPLLPDRFFKKKSAEEFPCIGIISDSKNAVLGGYMKWISEFAPGLYCEISEELAREKNLGYGDNVKIISPRGTLRVKVLVTSRIANFNNTGLSCRVVRICGLQSNKLLPYCNEYTPGNESKSFPVDLVKEEL